MMERYVWLVEITHQEEWRYVSMEDGAQCVMMDGIVVMLEWRVDNLDYQLHVSVTALVKAQMPASRNAFSKPSHSQTTKRQ